MYEAGTGAIRSDDLAKARWDLMSGASLRFLRDSSNLFDYDKRPLTLVNEAIEYAQRFLGCEHEGSDDFVNRLSLLGTGWWKLSAAIQLLDATSQQLDFLKRRVNVFEPDHHHYPYWALTRLAYTCHEGAVKYAEENWLHGFQVKNLMNHGIHHMVRWANGFGIEVWGEEGLDRVLDIHGEPIDWEDDLGHSMWSFMSAGHMMIFRSQDMCQYLLGMNYSLTPEIQEMHKEHASRRGADGVEK